MQNFTAVRSAVWESTPLVTLNYYIDMTILLGLIEFVIINL